MAGAAGHRQVDAREEAWKAFRKVSVSRLRVAVKSGVPCAVLQSAVRTWQHRKGSEKRCSADSWSASRSLVFSALFEH